jgi:hypothetical protein
MAKLPPERLAKALKANLKRRKQQAPTTGPAGSTKDPEKPKENPVLTGPAPRRETTGR